MRGISGKFIPEAIEINTLTPANQALHVRTAETEMPKKRTFQHLFPGANARHRRIHHDEFVDPLWMGDGESESNHVANVVRHHVGAFNMQRIHYANNVFGLVFLGETIRSDRRKPHSAEIWRDDRVIAHK